VWVNKQARPGLAEKVLRQVTLSFQARTLLSGESPA
jgi:hypothetical protein